MTDARRICRGVKSVFVPGALETADIATIRPSFRGEREAGSVGGGRQGLGVGVWCVCGGVQDWALFGPVNWEQQQHQ